MTKRTTSILTAVALAAGISVVLLQPNTPEAESFVLSQSFILTVDARKGNFYGVEYSDDMHNWTNLWERPNEFIFPELSFEVYITTKQRYYRQYYRWQ